MKLDIEVSGPITRSTRARQLEGSFDVPPAEGHALRWFVDAPIEDRPEWQVGLIVGPSGCGKSTLLREAFGDVPDLAWGAPGVIDDFAAGDTIDEIAAICSAVGFNTIPAWLRPFNVLSNGEKFRVDLARRLIDSDPDTPIVLDEWTSVVDRQVARIGSHAAQKWVRRNGRRLIAATCHTDVEDWLQPDWVIEPRPSHLAGTPTPSLFRWRSVRPRPPIDIDITPATYDAWALFAPFHYLTAHMHTAAKCYVLWARTDETHEWQPAAFAGVLHRPKPKHQKGGAVWGLSRVVTLPDWQGLGLAFVLMDTLAAAYKAVDCGFNTYPAHPSLIHAFDRSPNYELSGKPEIISTILGPKSKTGNKWRPGARPNATFRYVGPAMQSRRDAVLLFRCGR